MRDTRQMTTEELAALVTPVPRTASEIYAAACGREPRDRLTKAERNQRRRLATVLTYLSNRGVILSGIITRDQGRSAVYFWRPVDADEARGHRPRRAAPR